MNQYICWDLVDLRKSNKYIWCYFINYDDSPIRVPTGRKKSFWSRSRKRLIEILRAHFINKVLTDETKRLDGIEEFERKVEVFKRMMVFFENSDGEKTFCSSLGKYHHIRKFHVDEDYLD